MNGSKTALKALVTAAALAVPVGLGMPAQAATTSSGCTVTPYTAEFTNHFTKTGIKQVDYKFDVTCSGGAVGRSIEVVQKRYDEDLVSNGEDGVDDYLGKSTWDHDFSAAGGTKHVTVRATLVDTDGLADLFEEVKQKVQFTVTSNGVTSAATAWESTSAVAIHE